MAAIADFVKEIRCFKDTLRGVNGKRLITVSGESLTGKTTLLSQFERVCQDLGCAFAAISLKHVEDPHTIMDLICEQLGMVNFPVYWTLSEEVALGRDTATIESSVIIFSSARVSASRREGALHRHLTIRLFQDIGGIESSSTQVVLLDDFERALPDTSHWIQKDLIPRLCSTEGLVGAIAGQAVPNASGKLSDYHEPIHLTGIPLGHWLEYAADQRLPFSKEYIASIHLALEGNPGMMITKFEETLLTGA